MAPQRSKRKGQGRKPHLRLVGISAKTLKAYKKAVANFILFLRLMIDELPDDFVLIDYWAGEFINACWQEGEPVGYAGHLISGLSRFMPQIRRQLPTARQFYSNWLRIKPVKRVPPLTFLCVQAMCAAAAKVGRWDLAATLMTAFLFFLRTTEFLALSWDCIKFAPDVAQAAIALPSTKTSASKQAMESLRIKDVNLVRLLEKAKACGTGPRLFNGSGQAFRNEFQAILDALGLSGLGFLPYSLRRGGAAHFFTRTSS